MAKSQEPTRHTNPLRSRTKLKSHLTALSSGNYSPASLTTSDVDTLPCPAGIPPALSLLQPYQSVPVISISSLPASSLLKIQPNT